MKSINDNIYISLSGGIDSEYVFKKFYYLNIPFIPVIVTSNCYKEENSIAIILCDKYKIKPHIIEVTEKDIFSIFYKKIYKNLNSFGINKVPSFLVAEYALQNNGICIYGEHLLGDCLNVEINDWDFYHTIYYNNTYDFFLHTPEIVYSLLTSIQGATNYQKFKCNLFNINYRKKIRPTFSKNIFNYYTLLKSRIYNYEHNWCMNYDLFLKNYF
jgi:hypothetical protein